MTTATQERTRPHGSRVLAGAALVALALGGLLSLLGAAVAGSAAAYGALAGTVLAVGVFAFGSFVVNAVAGAMPAASLLVALLTYTLQVVAMLVLCLALARSGLLGGALGDTWFAAGLIAATLAWMIAQIILVTRARMPVFDLPEADAR